MTTLSNACVLEDLGVPGDIEAAEDLLGWQFRDTMAEYREKYEESVILPSRDGGDVNIVGMIYKVSKARTKNGKPFATWKIRWDSTNAFDIRMWSECESMWDLLPGSVVRIKGEWQMRWLNVTVGRPSDISVIHAVRVVEGT